MTRSNSVLFMLAICCLFPIATACGVQDRKDDLETNDLETNNLEMTTWTRQLAKAKTPLVDWHIHLRGGMTAALALDRTGETGVKSGVLENIGRDWPLATNAKLKAFIDEVERTCKARGVALGKDIYVGVQTNDRDWYYEMDEALFKRLDYVLADTMIMDYTPEGKPQKLWFLPKDHKVDAEKWMERYVRHTEQVLDEPIDILANPTYLPPFVADRYDELWTVERMKRVIGKAVANGVALEIQAESFAPNAAFVKLARSMGAKFTVGTNNFDTRLKDRRRWRTLIAECGLTPNDFLSAPPDVETRLAKFRKCRGTGKRTLRILKPQGQGKSYDVAASEFQKYYREVTGITLDIVTDGNDRDDYIVLGTDGVNRFVRRLIEDKVIPEFPLKIDSDDYRMLSVTEKDRHYVLLAGGRGRSTLYAVYDFFERRAGCVWFWDGDIVPKLDSIDLRGLDVRESPRFAYRGLRYFAHRGLHRFQAEHWSLEDWKKEIDWIVKKRLNMFMLRIGQDDMFQKAFPDIVPYPDASKPLPSMGTGYDNRSLFWSLEYRGQLRKQLLAYAFDRDLMHPEDMGTMTHWYSATPQAFLDKVNPAFVPQVSGYGMKTQLVWDARIDANLDNYWKLTQAHIDHYGKPELFHTIGFAERMCYRDRVDNQKMKVYIYRRLITHLRQRYPNAPLLLASWDFYGWWKNEEIQELLKQLDPANTIIMDYSADLVSDDMTKRGRDFSQWGIVGRFPYIFGIFLAYESALDIRGRYDVLEKQQVKALDDPYCKGYILWPECSHTDAFMLHYFTRNAWRPGQSTPDALLDEFCASRYGEQSKAFAEIWKETIPVSNLLTAAWNFWALYTHRSGANFPDWTKAEFWKGQLDKTRPVLAGSTSVFGKLDAISWRTPFDKRDSIDLARTTLDRLVTYAHDRTMYELNRWSAGQTDAKTVGDAARTFVELTETMRDLLALHDDYSMYKTLVGMDKVEPIRNPEFDKVLLDNASCGYCASHQYELVASWYLPVFQDLAARIASALKENGRDRLKEIRVATFQTRQDLHKRLLESRLADMGPKTPQTEEAFHKCMKRAAALAASMF